MSVQTVCRYISGSRIPNKEIMRKIYEVTHGAVQPNDFYILPQASNDIAGGVAHDFHPLPYALAGQMDLLAEASS